MLVLVSSLALAAPPKIASVAPETEASPAWESTLDHVVNAVVALRVTATRDFDTEDASYTLGTGFIVDKERGIILTNRHMVHTGPVVAEAVFLDHEEVDLEPIYRDPIHDFGFYRFDPKKIQYMHIEELPLDPEAAKVGVEIRVVGNDAGEKISILDGTLARLDRNAPSYGENTYNDFNTFYYQAASNTSGGSSGSPVVDIKGRAIALNAGGSRGAASSFYLPLGRVKEALQAVQAGRPVPRGTIQTGFTYTPFDEVRRLGLPPDLEAEFRKTFPQGTGALVVSDTIVDGSGWDLLQSGDILVRAGGRLVGDFEALEDLLDANVGEVVPFELDRGGKPITVSLPVSDLHTLSPSTYLEVGRAIFNRVSLMQARNHGVPPKGVYVASPGYWLSSAGIPGESIITEVDGVPTDTLEDFRTQLEKKAQGQRVRLRYHTVDDFRHDQLGVATLDRLWYPMQTCVREDAHGTWPCVESPPPPPAPVPEPSVAAPLPADDRVPHELASAIVVVDFDVPHPTAGIKDFSFAGAGLVVDPEQGLVVVDRDTVPESLGDMTITFGGSVRIPGRLVYLHPLHDFAVIQYDPKRLGKTRIQKVRFVDRKVKRGETVWQVGIDQQYRIVSTKTQIDAQEPIRLGLADTPRFRDANIEGISLRNPVSSLGGVVADRRGGILALWASFVDQADGDRTFRGLPMAWALPTIDAIRKGQTPNVRSIGAEFGPITLADARERNLSDARAAAFHAADPRRLSVLEVRRTTKGFPAENALKEGDLLLELQGRPVTSLLDVELASREAEVNALVLRNGTEIAVKFPTVPLSGDGVDRVVSWAGLVLHAPHLEVASQQDVPRDGVYVAWLWYGSPAARYGVRPTRRIVEVDGERVADLDAFLALVRDHDPAKPVRLKLAGLDGKVQVATMKLDPMYWPTWLFERKNGEWSRTRIDRPGPH
jgi:S1-C subfamily serine protease